MNQTAIIKALHRAIETNNLQEIPKLLQLSAPVDALINEKSPLHKAAALGHCTAAVLLLGGGAAVQLQDKDGNSALHYAAHEGHLAVCNRLIKAGAAIESMNKNGDSPLHLAAAAGHTKIVLKLLDSGANIALQNHQGNTAIGLACQHAQLNVLRAIDLSQPAYFLKNNDQNSPFLLALIALHQLQVDHWEHQIREGSKRCTYSIQRACFYIIPTIAPVSNKALSRTAQKKYFAQSWFPKKQIDYLKQLNLLYYLIKKTALNIDANSKGLSPLHMACIMGEGTILAAILKHQRRLNPSYGQISALHLLACSGRLDGLSVYLNAATADEIHHKDSKGWTVLHYLADAAGTVPMLQLLLSRGANPLIKSLEATEQFAKGSTAAQIAVARNNLDLAIALDSK